MIVLGKPEDLAAQVSAVFSDGAEVIFDTTGHWLPATVAALRIFGRVAFIAAPLDGHVHLPALALYNASLAVFAVVIAGLRLVRAR